MELVNQVLRKPYFWVSRVVGPRPAFRAGATVLVYSAVLALAFSASYALRWDFAIPVGYREQCLMLLGPVVLAKLLLLGAFGQFRSVFAYFSVHDFGCILAGALVSSLAMFGIWFFTDSFASPPRGVILIDGVLTIGGLSSVRLAMRLIHNLCRAVTPETQSDSACVAIIGAGDTGAALASDLLNKRSFGKHPVVFLDDDPRKWDRQLHGVTIVGPISRLPEIAATMTISEVILTLPGAGPKKIQEVIGLAQSAGLKASIVPSFTQLAGGDVQVNRFRPVELEDLLGRPPAILDSDCIDELLRGEVVLVTGAGGSIGSELCRQIVACNPRRLLLVDQSEVQLFQIEQELVAQGHGGAILALVADILDSARVHEILDEYRPSTIFHAAAHKHVYMMERQPAEAVKNNFLGTYRLAQAAREFDVRRFVLISTDKAINPTSVMGASKRLAEFAILGNQNRPNNRTTFMAVRFGNVLGSSGSVIPIFKRQIAAGGPVTVTHPEVTRYFMTIPEAVGLVLQAATMGDGGEVFVLDMGTPMKIVEVARQLIHLSGFRPDVDIEVKFVGLRPGEKLFEELQHTGEHLASTSHPRVLRLRGEPVDPAVVEQCLAQIAGSVYSVDGDDLKRLIKRWVPEYTPCYLLNSASQEAPAEVASASEPVRESALASGGSTPQLFGRPAAQPLSPVRQS